jgi:hypothetical protein
VVKVAAVLAVEAQVVLVALAVPVVTNNLCLSNFRKDGLRAVLFVFDRPAGWGERPREPLLTQLSDLKIASGG